MQHGRVVGFIQRSETGCKCSNALIAAYLKVENIHHQSVSRFCALNIKGPGKRIVALSHAERVPRLLDGIAEAVERIGVENVPRSQASDGRYGGVNVLHVVDGGAILNNVARRDLGQSIPGGKA